MKIEYENIKRYKELDLPELLTSTYGHDLKRQGEGYVTLCPFHDDTTPSFSINKKGSKWLWHCFGCRKGGTVFQYVMMREGLSLRETYGWFEKREKPHVSPPGINKLELLKIVAEHYHNSFLKSKKAVEYMKERGITDSEIYHTFKIGYAEGTIKDKISIKGNLIKELKDIGILMEKGGEFFYDSIVIPLYDTDGNVVSFYGRNIEGDRHLYLKGPHKGLVNHQGAYDTDNIIITESIIDAISLYQMGKRNVVPCYGTNGFTGDHKELIKKEKIKEVKIAYDNDRAGEEGAKVLANELIKLGVNKVGRVVLPRGIKDINELLLTGEGPETLKIEEIKTSGYEIESEGSIIRVKVEERSYRIRLPEGTYVRNMRVNIKLVIGDEYTIDVVDLYSERSRRSWIKRMEKRFCVRDDKLEKDLFRIIEEIEKIHTAVAEGEKKEEYVMTDNDKEEAVKELKSPGLIERIIDDLGKIGCIGEELNKLLGYIVTVSRKLEEPLSMIIVSSSAAGKSNLAGVLEEVTPGEESLHLSRITPQALYYMDKEALKRKVLVIEEKEGSSAADYSIRVLQSKSCLRLAVPIKDPATGKLRTEVFEVEGPVVVIETTTKTDLNPENTSRCFIVYLDETESQTKRIHEYQKRTKTIEGSREKEEIKKIIRKHRNMQRILEEVRVSIPYAEEIKFPTKWIRVRRDNMKFLNLIEAVTFLHQYQRERKRGKDGIEYIESTLEDYGIAYRLAKEVIDDSLGELMKPERELYEKLEELVVIKESITRRDVRGYTGMTDHVVRRLMNRLVELEYVLVVEGKNGVKYEYKLNPYPEECRKVIKGLTRPEELKRIVTGRPEEGMSGSEVEKRSGTLRDLAVSLRQG